MSYQNLSKSKIQFDAKWISPKPAIGSLSDYALVRTIGRGKFGRVLLARSLRTKQLVSVKMIYKADIIRLKQLRHIMEEKRVLYSADHPFLIRYVTHFKSNSHLFFVTEYANGGDLGRLLQRVRRFDVATCKFYVAQVLLCFEYLHYMGVVYRDLKPENLLLDRLGYLKLVDFGFAKKIDRSVATTLCGTPEYFAPELVNNKPYSYEVDWWTLGVLTYELRSGIVPFQGDNLKALFDNIREAEINYPSYFEAVTVDLLGKLLQANPQARLSSASLLKLHVYFKNLRWDALYDRKLPAPDVAFRNERNRKFDDLVDEKIEEYDEVLYEREFRDF